MSWRVCWRSYDSKRVVVGAMPYPTLDDAQTNADFCAERFAPIVAAIPGEPSHWVELVADEAADPAATVTTAGKGGGR